MSENKALDILGIKPIGDAINTTVSKSFEGVEAFLKLTCAPALEELGLMARDQVRSWRLNNIFRILEKAQGKLEYDGGKLQLKAHPRIGLSILENGSLIDDDVVQDMWAGLFVSSCSEDGKDDQNLIFIDLVKQLTSVEARILKYVCCKGRKIVYENGLVLSENITVTYEELVACTEINDIHRLDRELDHLKSLDLIKEGFMAGSEALTAKARPTALALNLFVRCQGYTKNVADYWERDLVDIKVIRQEELEQRQNEQKEKAASFERKLDEIKNRINN